MDCGRNGYGDSSLAGFYPGASTLSTAVPIHWTADPEREERPQCALGARRRGPGAPEDPEPPGSPESEGGEPWALRYGACTASTGGRTSSRTSPSRRGPARSSRSSGGTGDGMGCDAGGGFGAMDSHRFTPAGGRVRTGPNHRGWGGPGLADTNASPRAPCRAPVTPRRPGSAGRRCVSSAPRDRPRPRPSPCPSTPPAPFVSGAH